MFALQASHPEVQDQVHEELQEAGLAAKNGKGRLRLVRHQVSVFHLQWMPE